MDNNSTERTALRQAAATQGQSIHIRGLAKTYGERLVLQQLNLQIEPGEFVAIVGRSGCGKSTLLRLIAGLEKITEGSIQLGDVTQRGIHPDLRFMFQDSRLLPWRRTLENVALGLPIADRPKAIDVLEQVGLAERAHEWPAKLSGGQRQRVALARALVHEPSVLLLDEPLGALDALTRIEMQQLIEDVWQRRGFTAVLVTHDVAEAVALADRVILIEEGRITLNERVDLPRPRHRGSPDFAVLEERILNRVLQREEKNEAEQAAPFLSFSNLPQTVHG